MARLVFDSQPQPSAPPAAAPGRRLVFDEKPGRLERARAGTEAVLKTQALPIAFGTAAGLGTSGGAPIIGAPAAALAGGAGEAIRQIGLRAVSSKQENFLDQGNPDLPQTMGESAALIAKRAAEQGGAELLGRGIGTVAKFVGKPLVNAGAKVGGAAMQGLTKIPAEAFERIFKNPSELFTAPLKSTIRKAYGKVGFLADETLEEAAKGATTSNAGFIRSAMKELKRPWREVNPKKLFDARKAIDAEIDIVKFAGGPKGNRSVIKAKVARLERVREQMNRSLDILAAGGNKDVIALRAADELAAKGAAANTFRSLVPRVNVMQSTPRLATAPFVVPAVAGGATALAGAAAKSVGPVSRAALGAVASGANTADALMGALRKNKRGR